jgi:hypothetical protein
MICHSASEGGWKAAMIEKIEALIARLAPEPVCDDCIAERLGLDELAAVQQVTHALAGSRGHVRETAPCALCGAERITTRKTRR